MTTAIAAAATVTGAAIPVIAGWYRDREPFPNISKERAKALAGRWHGTGEDIFVANGEDKVRTEVEFSITVGGKKITCDIRVTAGDPYNASVDLKASGGFFNQDLVQLAYRSAKASRVQYGVFLFEFSPAADRLNGNYAGYSPTRECLILGKYELQKRD